MNILLFAFLQKFPGRCLMDATNQSSKYFMNTFQSHENRGSSTLEYGTSDSLSSNLLEFMSLIFIMPKNLFIKEQNFAVLTASGGPYFNKALLTVELSTFAASLTFIM